MKSFTREQLLNILNENEATIIFTKADGSKRTMHCTRNQEYIAKVWNAFGVEEKTKKAVNEAILNVWDIDSNGWRSFRIESVVDVLPGPTLLTE